MDTGKLKTALGKIHPDQELLEQVKARSAQQEGFALKRRKLYRIAYVLVLACVFAAAAGIYGMHMVKGPEDQPNIARTGEGQTGDAAPYSAEEQETLVYGGQVIILLDECSGEERETVLRYPEEGTICYIQDSFFLVSQYTELFQNILGDCKGEVPKAAVLVYWEGKWDGKQLEPLKEAEQAADLIPAAHIEEILKFVKEVCQ